MKIGVFYRALLTTVDNKEVESIDEGIKVFSKAGVSYYEVCADDLKTEEDEIRLLSSLQKYDAFVGNLYFKKEINSIDKQSIEELISFSKTKVEQCNRLHCKQLMPCIFLNVEGEVAYNALTNYYDIISDYASTFGISTVFENSSEPSSKSFTIEDIKKLLDKTDKLGYLLDTGNYWFSKEDTISALNQNIKEIKSVHLKDVLPNNNEDNSGVALHRTTLGHGVSSIKETIKRMGSIGYENGFTIELDVQGSILPRINESIDFIKKSESEILLYTTASNYYDQLFNYAIKYEKYGDEIELKTLHMFAVANIMNDLAIELKLDKNLHKLAIITGLFHDIGRYEQFKRFNTFVDAKSIDHANLSAEILEQENLLSNLSKQEKSMVITAIKNHNKYMIDPSVDGDTLVLCKMIRDADKTDIFRVVCSTPFETSYAVTKKELEESKIADAVYEGIMNHKLINTKERKYPLDYILCCMAFIFDINYPASLKLIKQKNHYLCKLDTLTFKDEDTSQKIKKIFDEISNYLS